MQVLSRIGHGQYRPVLINLNQLISVRFRIAVPPAQLAQPSHGRVITRQPHTHQTGFLVLKCVTHYRPRERSLTRFFPTFLDDGLCLGSPFSWACLFLAAASACEAARLRRLSACFLPHVFDLDLAPLMSSPSSPVSPSNPKLVLSPIFFRSVRQSAFLGL